MKIQSLEQGLPGTAQMKLLTGGFEAEPLLAHWIQAVALLTANQTQAVAPLLAKGTCAVPCIDPKHKGEQQIKLEKDQIKEKFDGLIVKKSIKGRNNSDLDRSGSFKPKFTELDSRSD